MSRNERKQVWDLAIEKEKKKKYRDKLILSIASLTYILGVISLFIIGTEVWIPIDNCECYYDFYNSYALPVSVSFFLAIFSYVIFFKITDRGLTVTLTIIVPAIFILYDHHLSRHLTDKRIDNNISIVKQGVIYKKFQPHYGGNIKIYYEENLIKKKWSFSVRNYDIKKLSVGDTILFVWVEKCKYIGKVYKFKPTKAELKECKNDCYLINGKLIPVSEYKNSKNKELY